jgi:hypothetical protein
MNTMQYYLYTDDIQSMKNYLSDSIDRTNLLTEAIRLRSMNIALELLKDIQYSDRLCAYLIMYNIDHPFLSFDITAEKIVSLIRSLYQSEDMERLIVQIGRRYKLTDRIIYDVIDTCMEGFSNSAMAISPLLVWLKNI